MRARWPGITAALLVGSLALTGCGEDASSAAEDAPQLATQLESVDTAIAVGRYGDARSELEDLVKLTLDAGEEGKLDDSQVEDILAAAAHLQALLPEPQPEQTETEKPAEEKAEPKAEPRKEPKPKGGPPGKGKHKKGKGPR